MARKIYLNGEMSNKFGTVHPFVGDTVRDAIRLLSANNLEFKPYLINCMEEGIQFSVTVHGRELSDIKECLLPLKEGDIIITPIPAGSKSGGAKILTAAAIAILLFTPGGGVLVGGSSSTSVFGAMTATTGTGAYASVGSAMLAQGASLLAINLAVAGIQQLMAPDPAVDEEEPVGYMLSGAETNIVAGDPVPILYGELQVPGQPVSFEVKNRRTHLKSEMTTWDSSLWSEGVPTYLTPHIPPDEQNQPEGTFFDANAMANVQAYASGAGVTGAVDPEYYTTFGNRAEVYGRSQDMLITDVISEGPIKGLVHGNSSVYLNGTSAVDSGDAAHSLHASAAHFVFTANSKEVTYVPNGQVATISHTEDGSRYLLIRDYKTKATLGVTTQIVSSASAVGSVTKAVKITTDADFFPYDSPAFVERNSWLWDRSAGGRSKSVVVRLSRPAGGAGADVIIFEGHIGSAADAIGIQSARIAIADPFTFNLTDFENRSDYKLHIDYAVEIDSVDPDGVTITLKEDFTGTTGNYKADITGVDRDITHVHMGLGDSIKHPGYTCQFLSGAGPNEQIGFHPDAGTGMGHIAIAGSSGALAIAGPEDVEEVPDIRDLVGTVEFGLSPVQATEADEIRIFFNYSSMFNKSTVTGNLRDGKAFYRMYIAFDNGSGFGAFNDLYEDDSPALRHIGQTETGFTADEIIDLTPYKPFKDFKVRVKRLSEDDKAYDHWDFTDTTTPDNRYTSNTQCTIGNLNTILKENLIFPFTSMAKVTLNTGSFTSPPKRLYHCKGMRVAVPSNYVTRDEADDGVAHYRRHVTAQTIHDEYQSWDGNFRVGLEDGSVELVYTNNPAWIFYDILTNNRYGLGGWMGAEDIDKFALYRVARYCDELVPDGNGGFEPRFTCNAYFRKAADAYKVLKDLSTVFRGMLYWLDGNLFTIMDEPKEPVYNFTAGNVIDGTFSYESTGSKTRSNQVSVTWLNPTQNYQKEALLVEDKENIVSTGRIISQNATAFGAVSEGQALRYGRWKLWTAKNQTEVVTFKTSISAAFLAPGDVVNIQDASRSPSKVQYSGRVSNTGSARSTTSIPLDRPIELMSGSTYELSILIEEPGVFLTQETAVIEGVTYSRGDLIAGEYTEEEAINIIQTNSSSVAILADGKEQPVTVAWQPHTRVESREVSTSSATDIETLAVTNAFTRAPQAESIWALKELTSENLEVSGSKKPYKILSISENNSMYNITAVEHYNEKFTELDKDFVLTVDDPVYPAAAMARDADVPPPTNFYALVRNLDGFGEVKNDVKLRWDPPADYNFVDFYELHHNTAGVPSPITSHSQAFDFPDALPGTYFLSLRMINTHGRPSPFAKTITVTIPDRDAAGHIHRGFGIPLGGTITRDIFLSETTSPTTKKFKITSPFYKFASNGSPHGWTAASNVTANNVQDITNIASVTFSSITGDTDYETDVLRKYASHWIFFDASSTSDHLKLIKYYRDEDIGVDYWYDTGTGNDAPITNFGIAGTGTVYVAAESEKVVGTNTNFNSDYAVGEIIRFTNYKAARVAHIASNTDMRIGKIFDTAIAAGSNHYPNQFRFDGNADAIIAMARNDAGTYEVTPFNLNVDYSLNTFPRNAELSIAPSILNFNGATTPVLQTTYDNIVLLATAKGYDDPEFKITGSGFNNTEISQTAHTSYQGANTGDDQFTYTLDKVDEYPDPFADLEFKVEIRETQDPENDQKFSESSRDVTFIKDGVSGTEGGDGDDGAAGIDSRTVNLSMGDNTFEYTTEGITPSPTSTTVTATALNTEDTPYYRFLKNDTYTGAASTTNTYTYTPPISYDDMPEKIEVELSEDSSGAPIYARDQMSVLGLMAGSGAITVNVYNEAHTLPATSATPPVITYTGSGTDIEVWRGTTQLDYGTGNNEWTVSATGTNITASTTTSTIGGNIRRYGDHDVMTADTAIVTYTITVKNSSGAGTVVITKKQTFSKSKEGNTGTSLDIVYVKAAPTPATPTASPGVPDDPIQWYDTQAGAIAAGSPTNPLWSSFGKKTGASVNYTWEPPKKLEALDGLRAHNGYLYWSVLQSGAPSGGDVPSGGTYTWATDTLTPPTSNSGTWSTQSPSMTGGTSSQKMWYVYWKAIQDDPDETVTDLILSTVYQGNNFTGLVKFDGIDKIVTGDGSGNELSFGEGGSTLIDGSKITTGYIRSHNIDPDDPLTTSGYTTDGMVMWLSGTYSGGIHSQKFYVDSDGSAGFKGTVSIVGPSGTTALDEDNTLNENTVGSDLGSEYGDSSIAGWTLSSGGLYSGRTSLTNTTPGIFVGQTGISLGDAATPAFKVTAAGEMTAENVTLTGYDNSLVASSIKLIGDDKVSIGNGASVSVGGTTYQVVGAFIDGGSGDTAGVVGICSSVGVAGQGATGGVYGQDGSGSWGWLGHSSAGVYASSLKIEGMSTISYSSANATKYLKGDGTWDDPSGGGSTNWAVPGTIGSTTPNTGAFTTLSASSTFSLGGTAVTSTAAELNLLDGVAGLVQADFTKLAAVTSSAAELNYVGGVTSAIQTQINAKDSFPSQTGNSGKYLKTNGSVTSWDTPAGGGGGDNYYLSGITQPTSSNSYTATWIVEGTTDRSIVFGANAFNSTAFTTNTGTTTHNNTQTFTNKSGDISQWTNDVGYVTSSGGGGTVTGTGTDDYYARWTSSSNIEGRTAAQVLSDIGAAASSHGDHLNYYLTGISKSSNTLTFAVTGASNPTYTFGSNAFNSTTIPTNNNQLTNGAGYTTNTGTTTASNTQTFTNKSGSNLQWTNNAGYTTNTGTTTASNTQTFTNKSGNISQWTNNAGYITSYVNTVTSLNAGGGAQTGALTFNGNAVSQSGATFTFTDTNTTYTVGDGGLTQKNFTTALYNKLNDGQSVKTSDSVTFVEVTASSDIRLKTDVKTIDNALEKVSDMRGVTFNRAEGPSSGVIAQELEEIAPELVKDGEFKSVAYGNLVGYLIEAIKELKDKVEELENGNSSN